MSRRDFLKSITALSTFFLAGKWPLNSLDESSDLYTIKKWELGASALFYNDKSFRSQLIVSCPVGYQQTQVANLALHAFNPDGDLVWRKIFALSPFKSTLVDLPEEWCSVIGLLEVEGGNSSPNVEMAMYTSFDTPFGQDGHHCLRILDNQTGTHLIPAPKDDEQVIVGFQNTSGNQVNGTIFFHREDGSVELAQEVFWNPFQTYYATWGSDTIKVPSPLRINSKERGLFVQIKMNSNVTIAPAAWVINREGSFTASHGLVESFPDKINPAPFRDLTNEDISNPVLLLSQSSLWYPGDLFCFGAAPFSSSSYESTLVVPNFSSESIEVKIILFDENGKTVGGTLGKGNEIIVPSKGYGYIDLEKLHFLDSKKAQYSSLICHIGQAASAAALVKIWTRSKKQFLIQHLRPQENVIKHFLKKSIELDGLGFNTDYWSFTIGNSSQYGLLIRNPGLEDETEARLYVRNENQDVEEFQVPLVKGGGYTTMLLKLKSGQIKSLRLYCKNGFLTLAFLNIDPELRSVIHGQRRVRYLANNDPLPLLPKS